MDAFNKHIKTLFENHEVSVDTEELWRKVEPSLGKRRFPAGIFFLLIFIGMLTVGILSIKGAIKEDSFNARQQTHKDINSFFGRKGQLINNVVKTDTPSTVKKQGDFVPPKTTAVKIRNSHTADSRSNNIIGSNEPLKENDEKAGSTVHMVSSESFDLKPRILHSTKKVATNTLIQPVISLFPSFVQNAPVIKHRVNNWKHSFDIFSGFDLSKKNLKVKRFDYTWYKKTRLSTEKYLESFNMGVQFNALHKSGFFVGTGLVYLQIDELFESKDEVNIDTYGNGIIEIITNADGSSTVVLGRKLVFENKKWNKRKYNNYQFFNIPVNFGYAFSYNLLSVEVSSGLDLNISFIKKGEIIGLEGFPVTISDSQNSIFRNNFSVNLNGGIKLLYPFSDKLTFYVEPNFHYNLQAITLAEYPIEQRYFQGGIRFGTRLKF